MNNVYAISHEINTSIRNLIEESLVFKYFENDIYSYGVVNMLNPTDCIIINNCSDWFDNDYLKNNRQLTDPVVLKALAGFSDFAWNKGDMINFFGNTERLFNDAEKFSITTGYTISFIDANKNLALFTLIMKSGKREDFFKKINESKGELKELLITIHVKNMALRGVKNSIIPPTLPERAQLYNDGETVAMLPLAPGDIVGSEQLFSQLLERAGYSSDSLKKD